MAETASTASEGEVSDTSTIHCIACLTGIGRRSAGSATAVWKLRTPTAMDMFERALATSKRMNILESCWQTPPTSLMRLKKSLQHLPCGITERVPGGRVSWYSRECFEDMGQARPLSELQMRDDVEFVRPRSRSDSTRIP